MTDLTLPRSRKALHGRHIDVTNVAGWLTQRTTSTAFVQTMLVVCLVLVIWPVSFGGRFGMVIVAGNSMEPTFALGDAVVTWSETVQIGDVILYRVPEGEAGEGNSVIHRVVGGDGTGWISQGDNSSSPDRWKPANSDVLGVAKLWIPVGGRILAVMRSWLFVAALGGLAAGLLLWPDAQDEKTPSKRGRHLA